MFFEEEEDKSIEDYKKQELYGGYSPHNFDVNITFFDALYEKIYSRWKFHFLIVLSLQVIVSSYYPIFFLFICFDILVQYCWLLSTSEYITQESHCDFNWLMSQKKGGDIRINTYVFIYYDALGYLAYGFNDVGHNICNEIYKYKNYMGLKSCVYKKKYIFNKKSFFKFYNKYNNGKTDTIKYNRNDILNFKNKFIFNVKKRKKLRKFINLNRYNGYLFKNHYKYLNFYLLYNKDLNCNFKNRLKKI